jgi:macrolide transport system ATP-binding/permease protein
MALIELKEVHKTYYIGGKIPVYALQGVSVSIEPGEFVAIMGPSGSGKSTMLAVLGLLDKADKGEYWLLNKDISSMQESDYARLRNRFFGFVFQTFNLLAKLTVIENAMLPFIYSSNATKEKREKVLETLKNIGLGDRLKHKSNELSGGQQQRVALSRALANSPLVILADEPTGNLDSKSSHEIMKIFKELNAAGNTIIMVTHERDIAAFASREIQLQDGKIVSDKKQGQTAKVEVPEPPQEQNRGRCRLLCFAEFRNYVLEALNSIANNKLRSFLSILGVMIGVAAVITMLALGTGAKMSMEKTLSSLGTNLLSVRIQRSQGGISMGMDSPTRFSFDDLSALQKIDTLQYVVPYVQGRGQAVSQDKNWSTSILGASADFPALRDMKLQMGRFYTNAEANTRAKVAVIGQTVLDNLYGGANPIGQTIKINKVNFTVIGVFETQGGGGFQNPDDRIVIPIKTAMYRLLGVDYISYFDVRVRNKEDIPNAQDAIVKEIMRVHRMQESQKQSINIFNMADIQAAASSVITTLSILLGAVAAVSLLVGGIGIMNIMLVMVMERTHEIGLRKALGAQRSDILIQFLIEAVLICFLGGIIGIIFGSAISILLSTLANWTTYISSGSIILSFTFSVAIGIIFGLWPAMRASKMLPIEALRYE